MVTASDVDAWISDGAYSDCCDRCRALNKASFWTWNTEGTSIATIHTCACGYTHRVAHWSVEED